MAHKTLKGTDQKRDYSSIPVPPRHAVLRPRLLAKMAIPGKKLTYIHADAGYGKTTLLTQYAYKKSDVIWISLDANDNDLFAFLQHLEKGIKEIIPFFKFNTLEYQPFLEQASLYKRAISALLQAIRNRRITIILDDVHFLNEDTQDFLSEWVKQCPPYLTLIMASRHQLWNGLLRKKLREKLLS